MVRWSHLERSSRAVINKILTGVEKGTYGYNDDHLADEYQKFIGINFKQHYAKGGK